MHTANLILASNSPRRRELLTQIGISFQVDSCHTEEIITKTEPELVVSELSFQKAEAVALLPSYASTGALILGADTVVALDGHILGKPWDEEDAFSMLSMLQGHTHTVYTGVTLYPTTPGKKPFTFYSATEVTMYPMSDQEIHTYLATKEPMDKAGSYAIQGFGARYISKINGDYNTVVGLPVAKVYQLLTEKFSEVF